MDIANYQDSTKRFKVTCVLYGTTFQYETNSVITAIESSDMIRIINLSGKVKLLPASKTVIEER